MGRLWTSTSKPAHALCCIQEPSGSMHKTSSGMQARNNVFFLCPGCKWKKSYFLVWHFSLYSNVMHTHTHRYMPIYLCVRECITLEYLSIYIIYTYTLGCTQISKWVCWRVCGRCVRTRPPCMEVNATAWSLRLERCSSSLQRRVWTRRDQGEMEGDIISWLQH